MPNLWFDVLYRTIESAHFKQSHSRAFEATYLQDLQKRIWQTLFSGLQKGRKVVKHDPHPLDSQC